MNERNDEKKKTKTEERERKRKWLWEKIRKECSRNPRQERNQDRPTHPAACKTCSEIKCFINMIKVKSCLSNEQQWIIRWSSPPNRIVLYSSTIFIFFIWDFAFYNKILNSERYIIISFQIFLTFMESKEDFKK